jgi:hypothetical protein
MDNKNQTQLCECCQKNPAVDPHICPYAADVNNDNESECTCCDECAHECAMDI